MSDERIRIEGSPVTHVVSWSDDTGGYARCGIDFAWHLDDYRTNAKSVASIVEDDCDCMNCLVRRARLDQWIKYQDFVGSLFKEQ